MILDFLGSVVTLILGIGGVVLAAGGILWLGSFLFAWAIPDLLLFGGIALGFGAVCLIVCVIGDLIDQKKGKEE